MVSVQNTETIEDLRENERFCLSEEQRAIFDEANRFAEKELYPLAEKMDAEEWWTEEKCEEWAKLLAVDIKDHEFQPKQPTTQMLGRFQPFHDGHKELFKSALDKHGQVAILVRDMPLTDDNPWQVEKICENIEIALAEFAGKFRCYPVPNIMNITYGRDVGYKIEEASFDKDITEISATKIRKQMKKEGKL